MGVYLSGGSPQKWLLDAVYGTSIVCRKSIACYSSRTFCFILTTSSKTKTSFKFQYAATPTILLYSLIAPHRHHSSASATTYRYLSPPLHILDHSAVLTATTNFDPAAWFGLPLLDLRGPGQYSFCVLLGHLRTDWACVRQSESLGNRLLQISIQRLVLGLAPDRSTRRGYRSGDQIASGLPLGCWESEPGGLETKQNNLNAITQLLACTGSAQFLAYRCVAVTHLDGCERKARVSEGKVSEGAMLLLSAGGIMISSVPRRTRWCTSSGGQPISTPLDTAGTAAGLHKACKLCILPPHSLQYDMCLNVNPTCQPKRQKLTMHPATSRHCTF
jgi:hypothetical protein